MNVKKTMIILFFIGALGFLLTKFILKKTTKDDAKSEAFMGGGSYYTCPMHPQIHSDKPGQCPICSMTLVKVFSKAEESSTQEAVQATFSISSEELNNAGLGVYAVKKRNLSYKIPFSGRFLSRNTFSFQAYEADLRLIKPGLPIVLNSSASGDGETKGRISSVDGFVDPASRTVRVTATLNVAINVPTETSGSGYISIELKDRVVVPDGALLHTGDRHLVYALITAGQVVPKAVKIGVRANGHYEVISGLDVGEKISSGPNFLLDSEARIRGLDD